MLPIGKLGLQLTVVLMFSIIATMDYCRYTVMWKNGIKYYSVVTFFHHNFELTWNLFFFLFCYFVVLILVYSEMQLAVILLPGCAQGITCQVPDPVIEAVNDPA